MLSNQKSSRFYSFKGVAFIAITLALLMNVTAFASENSRFAFIDTAAEFFGLQSNNVVAAVVSNEQQVTFMAPCTANSNIPVSATIPVLNATPGPISIPILVPDLTDCTIISFDLNVNFDPAVVRPAAPSVTQTGTVSSTMIVTPNFYNCQDPATPTPMCTNGPGMGHITISAFQASPVAGGGTLLFLNFVVQPNPGSSTALAFADYTDPTSAFHPAFVWNENNGVTDPIPAPVNGSLTIPVGPTATSTNTNTPTPSVTNTTTPTNTATNTSTPTPSNTATNTPTPTPTPLCVQVDIDDKFVSNGDTVTLAVTTTDPSTIPAFSADMHISYDTTVLSLQTGPSYGVTMGGVATSNGPRALTVNQVVSGTTATLFISVFGQDPFLGAGELVNITWATVTGAPGTFSPVTFTPFTLNGVNVTLGFWYNENNGASCVNDGSVTIQGTVGGRVKYGNAIGAPANRWISDVLITGNGIPTVSDYTDNLGFYSITGFGAGNYTMVPTRGGTTCGIPNPTCPGPDTHGSSITAYDAAITAQHVVQLIVLNPTQQSVAKVSGDTTISSFDSAKMAQWAVSLPGTVFTGNWRFAPSSILHLFVGSIVNEDYLGFLMGDVSGNWCDPTSGVVPCNVIGTNGGPRPVNSTERSTAVNASKVTAPAGSDVVIPVSVTNSANKGIIAYQFDLRYDPTVIQPQANAVTLGGTVSNEMSVVFNPIAPGMLRVAVYGPYALNDSGTLLNFHFTAVGAPFSASPITWERFMFNEGGIKMTLIDGQVAITPAVPNTAAE